MQGNVGHNLLRFCPKNIIANKIGDNTQQSLQIITSLPHRKFDVQQDNIVQHDNSIVTHCHILCHVYQCFLYAPTWIMYNNIYCLNGHIFFFHIDGKVLHS